MTNGPKSFAVEMPFFGMTSASGQPAFLPADSLNPNYIPTFNFLGPHDFSPQLFSFGDEGI